MTEAAPTPVRPKGPAAIGRTCRKCGADRWILTRSAKQGEFYRCAPCNGRLKAAWLKRHPDKRREMDWRDKGYAGLTVEKFNAMHAAQGGACACCKRKRPKLVVDHDHKTGRVRGLLCRRCNLLAQDADVLRAVIAYMERGA